MNEIFAGLLALGVPAFLIGSIVLWRTKPVLMMYYSLLLMGLGYLTTTGAVEDVGKQALVYINGHESAPAPLATTPASPTPAAAEQAAPTPATATAAPNGQAQEAEAVAPAPAAPAATPDAAPAPAATPSP